MRFCTLTNCCLSTLIVLFTACSGNEKKVMVLIKGDGEVDEKAKTIIIKNGVGNTEKQMSFSTGDAVTIQLTTPETKAAITIPENGYYVLNAKNDTIIGSYQNYGAPATSAIIITQAKLKQAIDSLKQLIEGKNISVGNRNYFILPYTAAKITNNANATIVAPYHQMTSIESAEDGKTPEVYRFWSIKEIRQTIADRVKDTLSSDKK
jgi:hypothetical protein